MTQRVRETCIKRTETIEQDERKEVKTTTKQMPKSEFLLLEMSTIYRNAIYLMDKITGNDLYTI